MKNKFNNIDEFIKYAYQNTTIPNDIFNDIYSNLNIKSNYNISTYIKYVACFTIIIGIFIGSIIFFTNSFNTNNQLANNNSTQVKQNNYASEPELPVASYTLNLSSSSNISNKFIHPMELDIIKKDSDCIAIVKLNKILYYTNYSKKVNLYSTTVLTVSDITVQKLLKGSLNTNSQIMSVGGIISISDFEKGCQPEQIKKHGFDKMSIEEKENTYIEIKDSISSKLPILQQGKYYLVYLKYNNKFEKYQVLDQFMYEYNINDSTIKNLDTNEWEYFNYN